VLAAQHFLKPKLLRKESKYRLKHFGLKNIRFEHFEVKNCQDKAQFSL